MTLHDVEQGFRALLLGREPRFFAGIEATRQRVYRDLVRTNLLGAVDRACPQARRLFPREFAELSARWLAESPPTTRFLWEVPAQFTAWLMGQPESSLPHAAFAELCHFEALEIEVTLSPSTTAASASSSSSSTSSSPPFSAEAELTLDASARLAVYRHPVHHVTAQTTSLPSPSSSPTVLLCFQRQEVFAARVLSPAVAKVLVLTSQGARFGAAVAAVVAEAVAAGLVFDEGVLHADLGELVDVLTVR